jgi:hypothetical protein
MEKLEFRSRLGTLAKGNKGRTLVTKCFADLLFLQWVQWKASLCRASFCLCLLCYLQFKTSSLLRPRLPYVLITLLQSILSVVQMPEAGRQIIYRIVIIAMLLLDGRERIEQCNEKGQTHDGSRW